MDEDESHFSVHIYFVTKYRFTEYGLKEESLGTTLKKYPSDDYSVSPEELLQLIYDGESFFPEDFKVKDYKAR